MAYHNLKKYQKKKKHTDNIFHIAVGPGLIFGNLFGIMPVVRLLSSDVTKIKFKWLSLKTLLSMSVIALGILETTAATARSYRSGFKPYTLVNTTFFIICEVGHILFFRLAMRWSNIIQRWRQTEEVFLENVYLMYSKTNLKYKIRIVGGIFLAFALGEHLFYLAGAFSNSKKQIEVCNLTYSVIENMYRRERAHYFDFIYFEMWMLPILAWLQLALTISWSFIDMFLTVSSISIAAKFDLITERLRMAKTKMMPESFWKEIRGHYMMQSELVYYLDDQLSGIILLSCSNGLYVTCLQLFNISIERPTSVDTFFSWYSLIFLICRTLATLYFASSIHDSSKRPLAMLRDLPTQYWSLEVQRFASDVHQQQVALSGKQFFFLTRKLILAMIGTVVTYELVLLDRIKEYSDITNFCQIFGKI